jgi:hypothetical protein
MPLLLTRLRLTAPIVTATLFLTTPLAWADSTFSASSTASTAAGSASHSLGASSNSSSNSAEVAQGTYTVQNMTEVAGRPDLLQLHLHAQTPSNGTVAPVLLRLPRATAEREQLAVGHTVLAQHRPYGLAFARLGARGEALPFFLVLDDHRHRELGQTAVGG